MHVSHQKELRKGSRRKRHFQSTYQKLKIMDSCCSNTLKNGIEETLDHISKLPDALLVQILSLLRTEDAVASCILSKRWSDIWTSIDNFLFSNRNYTEVENLISFMDHVLTHSTCSKIKKFQLNLGYTSNLNLELEISRYISFAVERKVEDVLLHSRDVDLTYVLPPTIYTSSILISLELSHWIFDKSLVIAWNSLKSLKLDKVELDDEDIVNLLSGCPALETLKKLSLFLGGFRHLESTSPNLKRLTLAGHVTPGTEESLEITAPHVQHLEITGHLGYLKCRLVNVSSLVNANITFGITEFGDEDDDEEDRNLVLDNLQKLSRVNQLNIGSWLAEVVITLKVEAVPLPQLRCRFLTLEIHVTDYNLYGIANLLETLPLLETLNIHLVLGLTDFYCTLQSYLDEEDNINLRNLMSNIVFPNLKNVKIVGCMERCLKTWSNKLFELLKFLTENAVTLDKFVIVGKRNKCWRCSDNCSSQYLSEFAEKLLDILRSFKNFVITYEETRSRSNRNVTL